MAWNPPLHPAECLRFGAPFSNFDFVERRFGGISSVRRLFSQARSRGCRTVLVESAPPVPRLADEQRELRARFSDFQAVDACQISFWTVPITSAAGARKAAPEACEGYAILKRDRVASRNVDAWHVFESVFRPYPHAHNYLTCAARFPVRIAGREFAIEGALYCQQNGLNKSCAHVALRSLLATYWRRNDFTFREIHGWSGAKSAPEEGLEGHEISTALEAVGVPFFDLQYDVWPKDQRARRTIAYQRILYSGVEAGAGALLAFRTQPKPGERSAHIIPAFGHTFNEDTWAPNAEGAYFTVGRRLEYIPSDSWTSSFLVHDDNFGSNLCLPKNFLRRSQILHAVALLPSGYRYTSIYLEAGASNYIYSLLEEIDGSPNPWLSRLVDHADPHHRRLILRTVPLSGKAYLAHLAAMRDWDGNAEAPGALDLLRSIHRRKLWMVEVSVPELFSVNLRKIGELIFDAEEDFTPETDFRLFVLARFPERYFFFAGYAQGSGKPRFDSARSDFRSHADLYTLPRPAAGCD